MKQEHRTNRRYSAEFKIRVISDMRNNHLTQKLMRLMGLKGRQRKHKYRSCKGEVGKVAANTLNRQFAAQKPFEKLVTDVTEFHVCNEKVYLSPVMNLFNREIVVLNKHSYHTIPTKRYVTAYHHKSLRLVLHPMRAVA